MLRDDIKYLRISLTNSCNLNCFYCSPDKNSSNRKLVSDYDQLLKSIRFLHTAGVRKIRFTGGEPTLYKKLPELIRAVKEIDNSIYTCLTSNGLLLGKQAKLLSQSGLDSVNISIDTLIPSKFFEITGRNKLNTVIDGIKESIKYIPNVKLNTVLLKSQNIKEILNIIKFANELGVDIRLIEFMPSKNVSKYDYKYISGETVRESLPYTLIPENNYSTSAAHYYKSPGLRIRIGFINPVSHPFCSTCNRIRLASNGLLYGCLFAENAFDLFESIKIGHEHTLRDIKRLIGNKNKCGWSEHTISENRLPSFINIGG